MLMLFLVVYSDCGNMPGRRGADRMGQSIPRLMARLVAHRVKLVEIDLHGHGDHPRGDGMDTATKSVNRAVGRARPALARPRPYKSLQEIW